MHAQTLHSPLALALALAPALLLGTAAPLAAQRYRIHGFEKKQLDKDFYCEGATFGDLNRDGSGDVIAGPFWYEGPDFERRHELYQPKVFDTAGYSDNFFAFVRDFDADGWDDVLFVGFPGQDASWYRNPQGEERHWDKHKVFDVVDNESPTFQDLTGDGRPELVFQTGDRIGWAAPDWSDPQKPWGFHPISPRGIGGRFTHGLGIGDVDGDGRTDILTRQGWWQQPPSLRGDPGWQHHAVPFADRGGAQMYVYDVDGDGDSDVISSQNAHGYGLSWFEQVSQDGAIAFVAHRIMGDLPEHSRYGLVIGNLHAVDLVDMNGDGLKDIVTGARYWAHGGRDRADRDPALLYWFELRRGPGDHDVQFLPHQIDGNSGVGTQVVAQDIDGDGLPEVVVGNKMGTFVHRHRAEPATHAEYYRARRQTGARIAELAGRNRFDRTGPLPVGADGKELNLDFEQGDLRDWTASGEAFAGMPNRGDTVAPRRQGSRSNHAGDNWVGTYEVAKSDRQVGTLTSAPFAIDRPFASFLCGGGRLPGIRVELVAADSGEVIYKTTGDNRENMTPRFVDLREHQGQRVFVRLVDAETGGWGHVNFDDFRFHDEDPKLGAGAAEEPLPEQKGGYPPAEAAERMTVPDGFRVDVVAGEPDLHQPIALAIDARGRVWVAEAFSYPVRRPDGEGEDKIVVFDDTDGDGIPDRRRVFQDGLNLVSGLEVGFGGVWVGAAPHFLFIPDRDGDLVPDGPPQILLDGFGDQDTHETLNAFNWGPDGWLYGCHGVFTHSRVGKPGTPDAQRVPLNAAIWRYHPQQHEFEIFAHGTSNPWGVDFDDEGQAFATACVIPHLYHIVQGGRYLRQAGQHFNEYTWDDIDTIADHVHYVGARPHDGNGVSDSVGGGHAHCGAMIYLGGRFPEQYRGVVFMDNIHGRRINTDILERDGSGFVGAHGRDFLLSNDRWFMGINLRYGPDGNVYLIDWYDKQPCHRREPEIWDRTNGRLYKVSYGDAPAAAALDVPALSDRELVALQLSPNDFYVRAARRTLQERGGNPEVYAALTRILREHDDPTRRVRALWALHVTGGLSEELCLAQLQSPDEYLRGWTIQLALEDEAVSRALLARLEELARDDPSPVVRLYLASALQRLPLRDRWPIAKALCGHAEDADDQNLPLMIWYGIEPAVPADVDQALELAFAGEIPQVARFILRRIAVSEDAALDRLIGALADGDKARRAVIVEEIEAALQKRGNVPMPATWPAVSGELLQSTDEGLRDKATTLAVIFGDKSVAPRLSSILTDKTAAQKRRRQALRDLVRIGEPSLLLLLCAMLDDPALCGDALRELSAFDSGQVPARILARFDRLGPDEQQIAVHTLTSRPSHATALLRAVVAGKVPAEILDSAPTRRRIAGLGDRDLDALMGEAWGRSTELGQGAKAEVSRYQAMLTDDFLAGADRNHGRALYAKTCAACHKLYGTGGVLGPDLTGSNRKDLDYILQNVVDPSAEVGNQYLMTVVTTKDGRMVSGMVTDENDRTITLDNGTAAETVLRRDIGRDQSGAPKIMRSPLSLMPVGQLQPMSDEDVRDLCAYLGGDAQVPMRADAWNLQSLFNGQDLTGWHADPKVWSVEDQELVGRTADGLAYNDFAVSELLLRDFRLVVQVKLCDNRGNSGIQLRSAPHGEHGMKGYQADIGTGWWGRLYEEEGRGLLAGEVRDSFARPGEWNTYEILAVGDRIQTALNGRRCVDLRDPDGAREGVLGLQVHSGGPTEVHFKDFELELEPEPELRTVQ